ncbi:unnamed protein product [Caenorhabditis auriculariae]|uniref:Uncharacterized protein n=1 Tax=Caenorhabditis auriculariae TaxID=2777116 RepID=A0A8S1HND2_9PELO|nr:unnamed protein product [Caenorhabditis auriculariae]
MQDSWINFKDVRNLPAFVKLRTKIRAIEEHKIAACVVPKTMSTATGAALCHLRKKDNNNWLHYPHCDDQIVHTSLQSFQENFKLNKNYSDWDIWFVKRHPIDRFISGFIDRCIRLGHNCHGCGFDIACYVKKLYEKLEIVVNHPQDIHIDDFHVAPQNWFCQMEQNLNRLNFLRYSSDSTETFLLDLTAALKEEKVNPSTIRHIGAQISSRSASHETKSSRIRPFLENLINSRKDLQQTLQAIYYWDFVLLDYPLI